MCEERLFHVIVVDNKMVLLLVVLRDSCGVYFHICLFFGGGNPIGAEVRERERERGEREREIQREMGSDISFFGW